MSKTKWASPEALRVVMLANFSARTRGYIDEDDFRTALVWLEEPPEDYAPCGHVPFTREGKQVLERAGRLAQDSEFLEPRHIAAALDDVGVSDD